MSAASPGPTSRIYFSQRLRLHYVDWGNTEAPPLLLVHGGRDHCRNWDWVAERLGAERPAPFTVFWMFVPSSLVNVVVAVTPVRYVGAGGPPVAAKATSARQT